MDTDACARNADRRCKRAPSVELPCKRPSASLGRVLTSVTFANCSHLFIGNESKVGPEREWGEEGGRREKASCEREREQLVGY